jgi:large subunit ribosomal protein L25
MSETRIVAQPRTEFGKGAARRARKAGLVPAVLYGHGTDPRHVSFQAREFAHAIKGGVNTVLTLQIDGAEELALPKSVVRHPLRDYFEHVDLLLVRRGEKVTVEVPVHVVGEAVADALVVTEHAAVSIEAEATHIPENIEVSIEGAEVGTQILASDLTLPSGSTLLLDPETLIVNVSHAPTAEEVESELAEAEAEAGIEHEAPAAAEAEEPAAEADAEEPAESE